MFSDSDEEEEQIELENGINLNSLLTGQTFQIKYDKDQNEELEQDKYHLEEDEIEEFAKFNLEFDSDEDDDDLTCTPFEKIAKKMNDVTPDGKIKKRVKRQGTGNSPPEGALVYINYVSFLEYNDEPTDYAYIKKAYPFRLGNANLVGLNFAVASMKASEKSLFLVGSDYAFGDMGHPPRIPPKATFLFQIELLRFVDSGLALEYEKLTNEDRKKFSSIRRTALAFIESAREHFKRNVKLAVRDYNRALNLIEECRLANVTEEEEQQKLKLRLLTNLAICYNRENNPKRACTMCNQVYEMVKNKSLSVPAKVYYQHGRALRTLGDYPRAEEKMLIARKMEPQNQEISKEILKLKKEMEKYKKQEQELADIFMQNNKRLEKKEKTSNEDEDCTFRKVIASLCEDLLNNESTSQCKLPSGITMKERQIAMEETKKLGLKFKETKHNENSDELTFYICRI